MKLPRDLSGEDLAKALRKLGYRITRQTSSHIRLTTQRQGEHHVTVPDHDVLRVGTLSGIIAAIGRHQRLSRNQLIKLLFGQNSRVGLQSSIDLIARTSPPPHLGPCFDRRRR